MLSRVCLIMKETEVGIIVPQSKDSTLSIMHFVLQTLPVRSYSWPGFVVCALSFVSIMCFRSGFGEVDRRKKTTPTIPEDTGVILDSRNVSAAAFIGASWEAQLLWAKTRFSPDIVGFHQDA